MAWNYFDSFVVGIGLVETITDLLIADTDATSGGVSSLRVVRILRIARMLRAIRIVRLLLFVRALRDLIVSIAYTMRYLAWSLLLLVIIIYVFAILFTQAATSYLAQLGGDNQAQESHCSDTSRILVEKWSTIPLSMLTLFQVVTNGIDWGEASEPLEKVSLIWMVIFMFYVAFCVLAVLNVVTSVFCQSAIENGQLDHDQVIFHQLKCRRKYVESVRKLFRYLDVDKSGVISAEEFDLHFHDECIQAYL